MGVFTNNASGLCRLKDFPAFGLAPHDAQGINGFTANDVADDTKKRSILISSCGPQTYQLLKNLLAPKEAHGKDFPRDCGCSQGSLAAQTIRDSSTVQLSLSSSEGG